MIPRGARLLTPGGHHAATTEPSSLSAADPERDVGVAAFYPGPEHNLDPAVAGAEDRPLEPARRHSSPSCSRPSRPRAGDAFQRRRSTHTAPLTGGELHLARRALPRAAAARAALEWTRPTRSRSPSRSSRACARCRCATPGAASTSTSRSSATSTSSSASSAASATSAARTTSPSSSRRRRPRSGRGRTACAASVESAIEDLRPISIFPRVELAEQVGIGIAARPRRPRAAAAHREPRRP